MGATSLFSWIQTDNGLVGSVPEARTSGTSKAYLTAQDRNGMREIGKVSGVVAKGVRRRSISSEKSAP